VLSLKQEVLPQKSITDIEHTLYSPGLAPNDFWLFPKVKRFQDTEGTQKNVTMALKAIPQQGSQKCFQQWQYSEGDPSLL